MQLSTAIQFKGLFEVKCALSELLLEVDRDHRCIQRVSIVILAHHGQNRPKEMLTPVGEVWSNPVLNTCYPMFVCASKVTCLVVSVCTNF